MSSVDAKAQRGPSAGGPAPHPATNDQACTTSLLSAGSALKRPPAEDLEGLLKKFPIYRDEALRLHSPKVRDFLIESSKVMAAGRSLAMSERLHGPAT